MDFNDAAIYMPDFVLVGELVAGVFGVGFGSHVESVDGRLRLRFRGSFGREW
jgi:hypothetical protein